MGALTRLKHWLYRMAGVVSPSGAYPPPPKWMRGTQAVTAGMADDGLCTPTCGLCNHAPASGLSTRPNDAQKGDEQPC